MNNLTKNPKLCDNPFYLGTATEFINERLSITFDLYSHAFNPDSISYLVTICLSGRNNGENNYSTITFGIDKLKLNNLVDELSKIEEKLKNDHNI